MLKVDVSAGQGALWYDGTRTWGGEFANTKEAMKCQGDCSLKHCPSVVQVWV